jgi:hypothetical protein
MTLTGLLRIAFRWKRLAAAVFVMSFLIGVGIASFRRLTYEAEVTIRKEPSKISVTPLVPEFDVTRFTSENERTITMLRSRFLMLQWLGALGLPAMNPARIDHEVRRLEKSLIVKPVNFTDLYYIKVQGDTPEMAKQRIEVLTHLFEAWDTLEAEKETHQLTGLLKKRLEGVRNDLEQEREELKQFKSEGILHLSGSLAESEIQTEIGAKHKLFDGLIEELDKSERQMGDSDHRVKIIIPITVSGTPVHSRAFYLLMALMSAVLLTFLAVFFTEWQSPRIFRAGDVSRTVTSYPVFTLPRMKSVSAERAQGSFVPLLESMNSIIVSQGFVVVQVISPANGDGKTTVCQWLEQYSRANGWSPAIVPIPSDGSTRLEASALTFVDRLEKQKQSCNAILIDSESNSHAMPGSNLLQAADIHCVVLRSGQTSKHILTLLGQQLRQNSKQKSFFALNQYEDPLPACLRV